MLRDKEGNAYHAENPLVMSGAGLCKEGHPHRIASLKKAGADKVVVGSITLNKRAGNMGPRREYFTPEYGLNAWGMPNDGIYATLDRIQGIDDVVLSLAGFSPSDYAELCSVATENNVREVELNFGCPNVWQDGTQHPNMSFDPVGLTDTLAAVRQTMNADRSVTVGVKLSPYERDELNLMSEIIDVINKSDIVDYVASTNTIPGQSETIDGKSAIQAYDASGNPITVGGRSGNALRKLSLRNAFDIRRMLISEIDLIRVGGISTGMDIYRSYQAGCIGVQIVTEHYQPDGGLAFQRAKEQYADLLG